MDDKLDKKSPPAKKPQKESVSYTKPSNQGAIGNIADRMRGVFSNKTTAILAVLVLLVGVGAATIAVQRSTEIRQRATASSKPLISGCGNIGDVDGDGQITNNDAQEVLQHLGGLPPIRNYIAEYADVNADGMADSVDSMMILQYLDGSRSTFPACPATIPTPTLTTTPTPTPVSCSNDSQCINGETCVSGICVVVTRTPTPTPTPLPTSGTISGNVYIDNNGDCIVNGADTGFSGVGIRLVNFGAKSTNLSGFYIFGSAEGVVVPSTRTVDLYSIPAGHTLASCNTQSRTVSLTSASPTSSGNNFFLVPNSTSTPTTTLTPGQSCPLKSRGDADCNGKINIFDFNIWRDEFLKLASTTSSNFDGSTGANPITIFDFNIWRDGFLDPSLPH